MRPWKSSVRRWVPKILIPYGHINFTSRNLSWLKSLIIFYRVLLISLLVNLVSLLANLIQQNLIFFRQNFLTTLNVLLIPLINLLFFGVLWRLFGLVLNFNFLLFDVYWRSNLPSAGLFWKLHTFEIIPVSFVRVLRVVSFQLTYLVFCRFLNRRVLVDLFKVVVVGLRRFVLDLSGKH